MTTTTLTPAQAELLRLLDSTPQSAGELADLVRRSPNSVRSMLLALSGKGLVKRDLETGKWRAVS